MKTISFTILSCLLTIAVFTSACNNEKEKQQQEREQARQDSLEQVRKQQQQLRQQRKDSLAAARADSIASENKEPAFNPEEAGMNKEGHYAVQVGAWRSKSKAQELAEDWKPRGFENAFVVQYGDNKTGNIWFRVRLGKFFTQEEAQKLQQWLHQKYETQSWISYVE
ncbi:MAG TPA: SPOR domain-containing protein [Balneolaceae bacterium]|nr:SPOR domain-containing protein [Balneolaceae bacterium]